MTTINEQNISGTVRKVLFDTQFSDIHTHLFEPSFGSLLLWGIDELLTYHYLVAELFRACPSLDYKRFWALSKREQADMIWKELFVKRSPLSEACRGILTVLKQLGLNPAAESLIEAREYFKDQTIERYVDKVFPLAKLKEIYMTNDPLDPQEWPVWNKGFNRDQRFKAVLRLDSALMNWPQGAKILKARGYKVQGTLCQKTYSGIRKYLNEWCDRMSSCYMAISLPPTFRYPDKKSALTNLFTKTVLATARERKIPVAMMIGVKKLVNPNLRLAGDSVGRSEIETLENLACDFSDVKFLVTMLSRENMHELCVTARKFKNIIIFGCWWFLNNPSLIREITAMRLELLGLTFVPQHSDARVLDQLIYKWGHSREIISRVLSEKYLDMAKAGGIINEEIVRRDVNILFDGRLVS